MALNGHNVPGGGQKFDRPEPLESGTYPCRLVQVLALGLQPQRPYLGEEKPPAQEIMLTYEFLDEFMKDDDGNDKEDKPRWLSETLPFRSLSNEKANTTKRYYALDPKEENGGDFGALVGTPCMVTIVQNASNKKDKDGNPVIYENIKAVSSMRAKDVKNAPKLVNPPKVFDPDDPDMGVFLSLPEWIQKKIKEGLEFKGSRLEEAIANHKPGDNKKAPPKEEAPYEGGDNDDEEPW